MIGTPGLTLGDKIAGGTFKDYGFTVADNTLKFAVITA